MSQAGQAGSTPPGGGPVNDITGDTGTTVSGHVKLYARTGSANSGSTVRFNGVSATEMDLQVTDTLTSNTFIGQSAGNATVSGNANTGLGAFALGSLTSGVANVTVGSLYNLTTGSNNVAVGSSSLSNCDTGDSNVALGTSSLLGCIAGQGNVGVGFNTGVQITGSFNTALGYTSLENCHGSYNTAVGNNSGHNYTSTEESNVLLANAGVIAESNVMRLGTQGSGTGQVNTTYVAGVVGNTVSNAQQVTINSSTGQLGVGASSGNLVLISSQTASNSAAINFTSGITGYDVFYLQYYGVVTSSANEFLQMQFSTDAGATYSSTGYRNAGVYAITSGGSGASSNLSTGIVLVDNTDVTNPSCGACKIFNLTSGSLVKQTLGDMNNYSSTEILLTYNAGNWSTTSVVNALSINFKSGTNIISGTFKLYGVQN